MEEILAQPRTVPESEIEPRFIDHMGHMNVTWYTYLFDRGSWGILARLGLDEDYMQRTGSGAFAVEQRFRYLAELRLGDRVAVHTQVTAMGRKSIKFTHTMIDVGRGRIAATAETVGVHVDRRTRASIPFPDHVARAAELLSPPAAAR